MKALAERKTTRRWKSNAITDQDISNLFWAACGQTKKQKGKVKSKRTTPSACNSQEIRAYALMKEGVFYYDEEIHELVQTSQDDIRIHLGKQKLMKVAPLGVVLVADLSRMTGPLLKSTEAKQFSAWVDTGYLSQNIYLYCAAAGLGTAALAMVDREELSQAMNLNENQKIVLTHAVGYMRD